MKNRNLIFITAEFPYGTGEPFIDAEFPFLKQAFDKIIIITNAQEKKEIREIAKDNVEVCYLPYELSLTDKLKAIPYVFSKIFWQEILTIIGQYKLKLTIPIIKTLLISIRQKDIVANFIENIFKTKEINPADSWVYSYWLNNMALGLAELKIRIPVVRTFSRAHRWDIYFEWQSCEYLPLRNFLFSNLNKCFAISEEGVNYLSKLSKLSIKKRISLSRLGTHANKIKITRNKDVFKIISCSSIIKRKRVSLIIDALKMVEGMRVEWTHFGDGELFENMCQKANLELSNNLFVCFTMYGHIRNDDLMLYYQNNNVDLFINVSESEGVPVSLMEAMSFGTPCIATNVGGTAEIVNSGNGTLLNSNPDIEEVYEAMLKFIKMNNAEYLTFRLNAYNTWSDNYNADHNYKEFIKQLLEL